MSKSEPKSPATLEIEKILGDLSDEAKQLVSAVFQIEQAHISEKTPVKAQVTREVVKAAKEAVQ